MSQYKFVLASQSPRRRQLLAALGISFSVMPARGKENVTGERPAEVVEELSRQKAEEVALRLLGEDPSGRENIVVIGADTVVAIDHKILGKPADQAQAGDMIREIQGRIHQVYTGVTVIRIREGELEEMNIFHECTDVDVYPMTEEEIENYIRTPEPYDKAGAYGIQGIFGRFIRGIRGDYNNVVGLPAARLYHELRDMQVL